MEASKPDTQKYIAIRSAWDASKCGRTFSKYIFDELQSELSRIREEKEKELYELRKEYEAYISRFSKQMNEENEELRDLLYRAAGGMDRNEWQLIAEILKFLKERK